MSGEQLAEKIRSEARYDSMKLILVSSITDEISRQALYRQGFSDVFSKPLTTLNYLSVFSLVSVTRLPVKTKQNTNQKTEDTKPKKKLGNKNSRILLVEDNKINQFLVEGILEDHNLSLQCVVNGVDAIATLQASFMDQPFTLILMDCHLPKMNGYEATRLIRQGQAGKRYTDIPIIAMTAAAMKGDREKCLECGMNDYISKPIDEDLFIELIHKWMNQKEQTK